MNDSDLSATVAKAGVWMDQVAQVWSVGEGRLPDGSPCVDVRANSPVEGGAIPEELDGYPVRVLYGPGPSAQQGHV